MTETDELDFEDSEFSEVDSSYIKWLEDEYPLFVDSEEEEM